MKLTKYFGKGMLAIVLLLLVIGIVFAADGVVIRAKLLANNDTAVSAMLRIADTTSTRTFIVTSQGAGHYRVCVRVWALGVQSDTLYLDSVSTTTQYIGVYSISNDSLMRVWLPDDLQVHTHSKLKRIKDFFQAQLFLKGLPSGNTTNTVAAYEQ